MSSPARSPADSVGVADLEAQDQVAPLPNFGNKKAAQASVSSDPSVCSKTTAVTQWTRHANANATVQGGVKRQRVEENKQDGAQGQGQVPAGVDDVIMGQ